LGKVGEIISKYITKLIIVLVIVILVIIMGTFFKGTKKQTIEELFNISINEIETVWIDKSLSSKEHILQYFEGYFKEYSGSLGNTAHRTFYLYDKNNKLLLEIEDIGNNEIVKLTGNNINGYYQFVKE